MLNANFSPHVTCAVTSVLEGVPGPRASAWRRLGWSYIDGLESSGFFSQWGFEPTDPKLDQFAKLKLDLGARRHLYGHHYLMLCYTRRANQAEFKRHYARAAKHLLANRSGDLWSSTAGELASTSLAVIALSAPHRRLTLYGKLNHDPQQD